MNAILYRAMDCYLGGSDSGYGLVGPQIGAIACTKTPNNNPPERIEQLIPLTPGSSYYQAYFFEVWNWISTRTPFPDTCACDSQIDNGMGISWSIQVPAGGSVTYSHLTSFSPVGNIALTTTKTADAPSSMPGGQNGYTITVTNPNMSDVTLTSISDILPDGFSYVPGSTGGVTTNNPTISGQTLTWDGSFNVPANGTSSLSFDVLVSNTPGTYFNNASAVGNGYSVIPTGDTAPITVELITAVTINALGTGGGTVPLGALVALALITIGAVYTMRRRR